MATAHGQTGYGTVVFVGLDTIVAFYKLDHIRESQLKVTVHSLRKHQCWHGEAIRCLTRRGFLRYVAIGHHHDHWFRLTGGDQIIKDLSRPSQFRPSILITTNAMKQIEHRILFLAGLIAGRRIHREATFQACSRTVVPDL